MSYTPSTWAKGDTITAAKLNNMESGISGAQAYMVGLNFDNDNNVTLDKTWQEILDAAAAGKYVIVFKADENNAIYSPLLSISGGTGMGPYTIDIWFVGVTMSFIASTPNDYPINNK